MARDNFAGICHRAALYTAERKVDPFFDESKRNHKPGPRKQSLAQLAADQGARMSLRAAEQRIRAATRNALIRHHAADTKKLLEILADYPLTIS